MSLPTPFMVLFIIHKFKNVFANPIYGAIYRAAIKILARRVMIYQNPLTEYTTQLSRDDKWTQA